MTKVGGEIIITGKVTRVFDKDSWWAGKDKREIVIVRLPNDKHITIHTDLIGDKRD